MAKIKLKGADSGSAVYTLTTGTGSTDRTINLPDATATIATTTDVAARLPSITDGGNATAITINSSEQVGIGTASPTSMLHIESALGNSSPPPMLHIKNTNGPAEIKLQAGGDSWTLDTDYDADNLIIRGSGTEVISFKQDGRGLSQFTAKAWINYEQVGTQTITDSHNVGSVTDVSAGVGIINFANNVGNTGYSVSVNSTVGATYSSVSENINSQTTSSYRIEHRENAGAQDADRMFSIVFGD